MPEGVMVPGLEAVLQMAEISATAVYSSASAARVTAMRKNRIPAAAKPSKNPPQLKGAASYSTGEAYNVRGDFGKGRRRAVIGKPTEEMVTFDSRRPPELALIYPVTVDGHTVEVIVSKNPPKLGKGVNLPSVEAIAKSLGVLEGQQLTKTERIWIRPYPSATDRPTVGKQRGTRRAAAAGGGEIIYYPMEDHMLFNQDSFDSLIIHESAHHIQRQRWDDFPEEYDEWVAAMASDRSRPSVYSANSPAEDFAESVIMYRINKGTPEEARARELFPKRYQILDEVLNL